MRHDGYKEDEYYGLRYGLDSCQKSIDDER